MTAAGTKQVENRGLLLIAYYSFILMGLVHGALNVAWEYIEASFGLNLDSLGPLLVAGMVGALAVTFSGASMMARFGVGPFLLAGTCAAGLGLLGYGLAPGWGLLLLANFVVGIGLAAINVGVNTYSAAHYPARHLNWLHANYGVGLTLGPQLVAVVVEDLGLAWQVSYMVLVGVGLGLVVFLSLTLNRWHLSGDEPDSEQATGRPGLRDTLRLPAVWLSIALFFVFSGGQLSGGQLTNSLFTDVRGIDPKTASGWISFYWLSFTIGRLVFGALVDWLGKTRLLRLCMLGAVVGAGLMWWNPNPAVSFAGFAVMGFSFSTFYPTLIAGTAERVGAAHTANAVGLQIGFASLGSSLVPGIGGVLATAFGPTIIAPFLVIITATLFSLHELTVRLVNGTG